MNNTPDYPRAEFLRDFEEWQSSQIPNGAQRAMALFSRRYSDGKIFAYRFKRFVRVIGSVASNIQQLVQDKIVRIDEHGNRQIPQELLLALHEWYCGLDDDKIQTDSPPDWGVVMKIYDRLKSS
jgi:hypothetical protein